ncbi:MAG: hypothetical protein ACE5QW_08510 [Thermoplasmata archaeon]
MPENFLVFDGKKFMWDGQLCESEEEGKKIAKGYEDEGFEVEMVTEEGKHLIYTRREVKEIVLEGAPPGL